MFYKKINLTMHFSLAALTMAEDCGLLPYWKSTIDPLTMTTLNGCVPDTRYDATFGREHDESTGRRLS